MIQILGEYDCRVNDCQIDFSTLCEVEKNCIPSHILLEDTPHCVRFSTDSGNVVIEHAPFDKPIMLELKSYHKINNNITAIINDKEYLLMNWLNGLYYCSGKSQNVDNSARASNILFLFAGVFTAFVAPYSIFTENQVRSYYSILSISI